MACDVWINAVTNANWAAAALGAFGSYNSIAASKPLQKKKKGGGRKAHLIHRNCPATITHKMHFQKNNYVGHVIQADYLPFNEICILTEEYIHDRN